MKKEKKELIDKYLKYLNKLSKYNNTGGGINTNLTISDGIRTFLIQGKDILDLELKLNLSPYGTIWKSLSLYLNQYATTNIPQSTLYVTNEQWNYLNSLKTNLSNIYSYPLEVKNYYKSNSSSIILKDGLSSLYIDGTQIVLLLNKLNSTIYAYKWPSLITTLNNCTLNISPSELYVSSEQMNIIRNLYLQSNNLFNLYTNNGNYTDTLSTPRDFTPDVWNSHPELNGAKIVFSDGLDSVVLRGEEIYKMYKKIKASKYYKQFKKIRKSMITVKPYNTIPIIVNNDELQILAMMKSKTLEYIESHIPKIKK